jgi:uncharacterized damage-inducible protein DinB
VTSQPIQRRYATGDGGETTVLLSFLDQYRDAIVNKIEGLDEEQARWAPTEQASSLLTLIVHLTQVEQGWMEWAVLGNEEIGRPLQKLSDLFHDRDAAYYELVDRTTVAEAVEAYLTQCERTNEIARSLDLDQPCAAEAGLSVRWVLLHILAETTRHAGHADINRELIDGSVGE